MKKKKLSIKKLKIAKLGAIHSIKGGNGDRDDSKGPTCTDGSPLSGLECTFTLPLFCLAQIK